jgi:excisionase family DNA binding protein
VTGRLLTADDLAVKLAVPKSWVYAETRAGRLPHVPLGRYRRYREDAVDEWLTRIEKNRKEERTKGGS